MWTKCVLSELSSQIFSTPEALFLESSRIARILPFNVILNWNASVGLVFLGVISLNSSSSAFLTLLFFHLLSSNNVILNRLHDYSQNLQRYCKFRYCGWNWWCLEERFVTRPLCFLAIFSEASVVDKQCTPQSKYLDVNGKWVSDAPFCNIIDWRWILFVRILHRMVSSMLNFFSFASIIRLVHKVWSSVSIMWAKFLPCGTSPQWFWLFINCSSPFPFISPSRNCQLSHFLVFCFRFLFFLVYKCHVPILFMPIQNAFVNHRVRCISMWDVVICLEILSLWSLIFHEVKYNFSYGKVAFVRWNVF